MEKSTCKFEKYFKRLLKEDMSAGDAGVGSTGGDSMQGDFYAPDDTRVPFPIFGKGKVLKRADVNGKKKKKKKKAKVFLPGENEEVDMCPDECCGVPVEDCTCGPDCKHCNCYEKKNG